MWYNLRYINTLLHYRKCNLCNCKQVGDEYHYLYICEYQDIIRFRQKFIPEYYYRRPSTEKMKGHLFYCNVRVLKNLARFVNNLKKIL